ncbi:TnsA endonuclease N-terminal domain-containing protein [Rhodomicrobium sp. Az07]|uniref:TnsA endonuclease N-terminal domain-containing protein n=1 Tax=Rhodomicrobium sp. Az07 TaxID=2839034 RepID=UPI001BE7C612|nr:TnsA endonuclease N-terminal domain-containing protein [Rhodomicrobium sp. Az07]MBT3069573.1 TnsA endonuclease N-terminal domain-containing protein [Rhodomicrobium sp. Az07]
MARQRYGFDEDKIERFLKEGRGQGRGRDYLPWLTIRDVPSRGRSHRLQGFTTDRVHHLLSDIECGLFYLADWSDSVTDIREQFPLQRDATQRIAAQLDVAHPCDSATRTPLVMTTDFLLDVVQDRRLKLMARAVKPASDLDKPRTLEKLEIERRYWLEQDVDWGIVTEREIPKVAVRNIAWVHSYGTLSHINQPYPGYLDEMAEHVLREISARRSGTLRQSCADIDEGFSLERGTALMLVRHLLARKKLRFPIDEPLDDDVALERFTAHRIDRLRSAL